MNNRHFRSHAPQAFHVISVCCVITWRKYVRANVPQKRTAAFAAFCRFLPVKPGSMMDKNVPRRVVITTKDIQNILGICEPSARELMQRLRFMLEKGPEQYVTVAKFCRLTELTEDEARDFLWQRIMASYLPCIGLG
jgi:hypothetical protein